MDSQANLSTQIETLAADLDVFMTYTTTPPLAAHLQKLLNSRNRLVSINTTLLTIMNRLDKISASVDPNKDRKKSFGLFSSSKTTKDSAKKEAPSPTKAPEQPQDQTPPPSLSSIPPPQQEQTTAAPIETAVETAVEADKTEEPTETKAETETNSEPKKEEEPPKEAESTN